MSLSKPQRSFTLCYCVTVLLRLNKDFLIKKIGICLLISKIFCIFAT